jgi:hypothetical protein
MNPVVVNQETVFRKVHCRMKCTTLSMDKSKSGPCLNEEGTENGNAIIITEPRGIDYLPSIREGRVGRH